MRFLQVKTGFTLVEVVVASILLAIIGVGIFSVVLSSQKLITRSERRHIALEVAQTVLENLRRELTYDKWNDSSTPSPIYPMTEWSRWHYLNNTTDTFLNISRTYSSNIFADQYGGRWCYKIESVPLYDYRQAQVNVTWDEIKLE